uniref:Uncharacterized protein n=1 Tax=Manihot esculenta TaxID=3983 RepID=A0A2C9WKR5_MANES
MMMVDLCLFRFFLTTSFRLFMGLHVIFYFFTLVNGGESCKESLLFFARKVFRHP